MTYTYHHPAPKYLLDVVLDNTTNTDWYVVKHNPLEPNTPILKIKKHKLKIKAH